MLPLGYCGVVSYRAQSGAENICSAIELGASIAAAEKTVSDAGIPELFRPTLSEEMGKVHVYKDHLPESLVVVYPSFLGERWMCFVSLTKGRSPPRR